MNKKDWHFTQLKILWDNAPPPRIMWPTAPKFFLCLYKSWMGGRVEIRKISLQQFLGGFSYGENGLLIVRVKEGIYVGYCFYGLI